MVSTDIFNNNKGHHISYKLRIKTLLRLRVRPPPLIIKSSHYNYLFLNVILKLLLLFFTFLTSLFLFLHFDDLFNLNLEHPVEMRLCILFYILHLP